MRVGEEEKKKKKEEEKKKKEEEKKKKGGREGEEEEGEKKKKKKKKKKRIDRATLGHSNSNRPPLPGGRARWALTPGRQAPVREGMPLLCKQTAKTKEKDKKTRPDQTRPDQKRQRPSLCSHSICGLDYLPSKREALFGAEEESEVQS